MLALCGQPNAADARIVNGIEATPNEFPWAVGLVRINLHRIILTYR